MNVVNHAPSSRINNSTVYVTHTLAPIQHAQMNTFHMRCERSRAEYLRGVAYVNTSRTAGLSGPKLIDSLTWNVVIGSTCGMMTTNIGIVCGYGHADVAYASCTDM